MTERDADVLVLGGGPAGMWAALAAATAGARVVLADKGRCGSTGPAAHGVTRLWDIPPGQARIAAVRRWSSAGGDLGEPDWMYGVMDETHRRLGMLARWGYRPALGEPGTAARLTALDPEFLHLLRRRIVGLGVRVLDYHPALQLLVDAEGMASGASGISPADGFRRWQLRAKSVVVATGGCAFKAGGAGTEGNTGDGHLMAAEVGAELSGMEFSAAYGLATDIGRETDNMILRFATFCDDAGDAMAEPGHDDRRLGPVFAAIADGKRVYARLADAPVAVRDRARRAGVDPCAQIPLHPVLEGTVRGTGGLRMASDDCATTVAGLFAAGDITTREAIVGAVSGIGGQSMAWATGSGAWAGAGAAVFARGRGGVGRVWTVAGAGMSPFGQVNPYAVIGLVQEHTVPLRRSYRRNHAVLRDSVTELDGLWPGAVYGLGGSGATLLRAREAAAMLAVARWATHSALARTESRGIHRRIDHPAGVDRWQVRLSAGGLDEVWVRAGNRLPRVSA